MALKWRRNKLDKRESYNEMAKAMAMKSHESDIENGVASIMAVSIMRNMAAWRKQQRQRKHGLAAHAEAYETSKKRGGKAYEAKAKMSAS
jgi:Mg-chelatase subunit ChlI